MQATREKSHTTSFLWLVAIWAGLLVGGIAIGRATAPTEPGVTRIDAYQRCVALIPNGAQWDESEEGWRCRVVPVEVAR